MDGTRSPFPNQIGTDAYYPNKGNSDSNALELKFGGILRLAKRVSDPLRLYCYC